MVYRVIDAPSQRQSHNLTMLLVRTHIGIIREFPRFDAYMRTDADVDTILYSNPSLRFREFIVKDVKRLYPEFLIVYDRLDKNVIIRV